MNNRFGIILIIAVSFLSVSAFINYFVLEPQYESSAVLVVSVKDDDGEMNYEDFIFAQKIIDTYMEMAELPALQKKVIGGIGLDVEEKELGKKIRVTQVKDTGMMKISAFHENANTAAAIANLTSDVLIEEGSRIIGAPNINLEYVDAATEQSEPSRPKKALNVLVASALGIVIGIYTVLGIETYNSSK